MRWAPKVFSLPRDWMVCFILNRIWGKSETDAYGKPIKHRILKISDNLKVNYIVEGWEDLK